MFVIRWISTLSSLPLEVECFVLTRGGTRKLLFHRVEAYAHPEVEHTLQNCGFTCVEWENGLDAPQKYYTLEIGGRSRENSTPLGE